MTDDVTVVGKITKRDSGGMYVVPATLEDLKGERDA